MPRPFRVERVNSGTHDASPVSLRPTRRTLVRGSAWSVPVVAAAAAAPAYAASQLCQPVTFDWSSQPTGQVFTSGAVGLTTITMTVTEATNPHPANGQVINTTQGGVSGAQLALVLIPTTSASATTVQLAFSQPVSNLRLQVRDIDRASGNWNDRVTPSPGYTVTAQGSNVRTVTGPPTYFDSQAGSTPVDGGVATGNLSLAYAGPLTSISLRYHQGGTVGGQSAVVTVGDLTFTPTLC